MIAIFQGRIIIMDLFIPVLIASITSGTAILLATLGEIITEKGGIINLGLEGLMLVGALMGFIVSHYSENVWLGFIAAGLAGGLLCCIHAFLVITLNCNQIVSGLALVILGSGLSSFLGQRMIGQTASKFDPIVFGLDIISIIAFILAFVLWGFLKYTRWGLSLISVGNNPISAEVAGISAFRIRYFAVIFGGALAGFGGAYLSLCYTPLWTDNMVSGKGWIAIALVIFSGWDPIKAVIGSYLFGAIIAITFRIQAFGSQLPIYILQMLPYIITIIALIFFTVFDNMRKKFGMPESLGLPYSHR